MNIGENINGYTLISLLGDGGMGKIFRAEKDGVEYAMKFCKSTDDPDVKRFKREVRAMAALKDMPHIVPILDYVVDEQPPYYVMPIYNGSLRDLVGKGINEDKKLDVAIEICKAISIVHRASQVHRDIKPTNIFFDDKSLYLADFGFAKFENRDTTSITATGDVWQSGAYTAPESINGEFKEASPKADVYSLGKTLYYLFSESEDVANINLDYVPGYIASVIIRCIDPDESKRYDDVSKIVSVLNLIKSLSSQVSFQDIENALKSGNALNPHWKEQIIGYIETSQHTQEIVTILDLIKPQIRLRFVDTDDIAFRIGRTLVNMNPYDSNYWLQFADVDVIVGYLMICYDRTGIDMQYRMEFMRRSIEYASEYNRYASMDIVISRLDNMTKDTLLSMIAMLSDKNDQINQIYASRGKQMPALLSTAIANNEQYKNLASRS